MLDYHIKRCIECSTPAASFSALPRLRLPDIAKIIKILRCASFSHFSDGGSARANCHKAQDRSKLAADPSREYICF